MHEERLLPIGSADPLRLIDPRFEPHDPLFDPDEPVPPRRRLKRGRAALAAIIATLGCGAQASPLHATDSVLVRLAPGAAPPSRGEATDSEPSIIALGVSSEDRSALLRVPLAPGASAADAAEDLAREPGVTFAEPVYLYRAAKTPDDARFKEQWGLAKIAAPAAWTRTTGAASTVVAVIDDGIALDHPDLAPNLWNNPGERGHDEDGDGILGDFHGASFIDGETSGDPRPVEQPEMSFHGSHVAGIIAAAGDNQIGVAGVSWSASLMGLRAFGPSGGRSDDLARAVDYAVDHGARIIDASWSGTGASRVLADAIERAGKRGVLFVSAAGNDGASSPRFPASLGLENLISVGASNPLDMLASFSNRAAMIAAPGVGILSTTAAGIYARYDGTSMASAYVAGVASLLWAAHPQATLAQVREAILESGAPMDGAEHGRVDASRALSALDSAEDPLPGALLLSRDSMTFASRPGQTPKPQPVTIRADGSGARHWTAHSEEAWVKLNVDQGVTPARVFIQVDPVQGSGDAAITFRDDLGGTATLTVSLQPASLTATGDGCALRGGKLHVEAGCGCTLATREESHWTLPGGRELTGQRLYAQYLRRGEFQLLIRGDGAVADPLTVVIE
jgi:subtilisin family serine protease